MITTTYGTWNRCVDGHSLTVEQSIGDYLYNYPGIDAEAVSVAYRAAINAALPDSVQLAGDQFYGPAGFEVVDFEGDGYPVDEDGGLDINAVVAGVDFDAIVEGIDNEGTNR